MTRLFRAAGLEAALLEHANVLDALVSLDAQGREIGRIDLAKIRRESGWPTVTVHRHDLHALLSGSIAGERVRLGHKVVSVTGKPGAYDVAYANGDRERYEQLIAADGIFSPVRQACFPDVGLRRTGQACWRFVVPTPDGLATATGWEMWGDRRRVGIFPLSGGRTYCFLVASMTGGEAQMDFDAVLRRFDGFGGPWERFKGGIDTAVTELLYGELADTESVTLEHQGIVFIGDAGHATTPNMGQGAAMAIESAFMFAGLAEAYGYAGAVERYGAKRYNKVHAIRQQSMAFGKLAHVESKALQGIRNALMRMLPQRWSQRAFERAIFDE